jgi:hypothetical protein
MGTGDEASRFLNFGATWRWLVSLTLRPIYPGTSCIGKAKLSPWKTKHHAMKTYGGVEVYLHSLISALDGGEL